MSYICRHADFGKYKYSGYGIGFEVPESFSLSDGKGFGKNVIRIHDGISSTVYVDNRKKYILILGKDPIQGVDDTTLTAKKQYAIIFSEQHKKFYLSLDHKEVNSYIFVSGVEIYKLKAKNSEISAVPLCLDNVSKDSSTDNMKKTELYGYVNDFSLDYDSIDVADILAIHKYLMNEN